MKASGLTIIFLLLNVVVTIVGGYVGLYTVGGAVDISDSFTWVVAIALIPFLVSSILLIIVKTLFNYRKVDKSAFIGLSILSLLIGFIGGAYLLNTTYV